MVAPVEHRLLRQRPDHREHDGPAGGREPGERSRARPSTRRRRSSRRARRSPPDRTRCTSRSSISVTRSTTPRCSSTTSASRRSPIRPPSARRVRTRPRSTRRTGSCPWRRPASSTRAAGSDCRARSLPQPPPPLQVTGVGGVPANGVAAVVLNLTVTETQGVGFVRVTPSGQTATVSSLNVEAANQTLPNLVTVPCHRRLVSSTSSARAARTSSSTSSATTPRGCGGHVGTVHRHRPEPCSRHPVSDRRADARRSCRPTVRSTCRSPGTPGVPLAGRVGVVLNLTATESLNAGYITGVADRHRLVPARRTQPRPAQPDHRQPGDRARRAPTAR